MKLAILILISLAMILSCTASLGNMKPNKFSKNSEEDEGLLDDSSQSTALYTDDQLLDDATVSDEEQEEDEADDVEEENFNNRKKPSGKSFSRSRPEKVGKKKSGDEEDEAGILDGVGDMMEDFKSSFVDKLPSLNNLNPINAFSMFGNPFDGISNPFSGFGNPLDGFSKSFSELGKSFNGFPKIDNPFKGLNMSHSLSEWSSSIKNHFGGSSKNENVNAKNDEVKKFIVIEDDDDE